MPIAEIVALLGLIWQALAPLATKMLANAMAGADPLAALAAEHVAEIDPDLKLSIAMAAERAREAASKPVLAPASHDATAVRP